MKCPKCGYHSFEHLDNCRKCGQDLVSHKEKFHLRGFYVPGQTAPATAPEPTLEESDAVDEVADDGDVDFGFDFLEEESAAEETASALSDDDQEVSIDQPFGVDSESVPADEAPSADEDEDSDDKPGKGPEFAF